MSAFNYKAKTLSEELSKLFNKEVAITADEVAKAYGLTENSAEATEIVTPLITRLLKKHNLKKSCHIKEGPYKRLMRMFAKKVGNNLEDIADVPDVGRIRLLVDSADDIQEIRQIFLGNDPQYKDTRLGVILDKHPTNNVVINEFEDYYHVPSSTGRVAIHAGCSVKTEKNIWVPFEIQVMLESMEKTEEFTRDNYMNAQIIRRKADNENRYLNKKEAGTVSAYDNSSIERYTADCRHHDLIKLRRPDLARQDYDLQKEIAIEQTPTVQLIYAA